MGGIRCHQNIPARAGSNRSIAVDSVCCTDVRVNRLRFAATPECELKPLTNTLAELAPLPWLDADLVNLYQHQSLSVEVIDTGRLLSGE